MVPLIAQAGFLEGFFGSILYFLFSAGNPCTDITAPYTYKLCRFLDKVANVLYVVGWSVALIVVLIGGITIMTAGGNEDNLKKGKKIITNGIIGAAIVLCAGFILGLLVQFLLPLII